MTDFNYIPESSKMNDYRYEEKKMEWPKSKVFEVRYQASEWCEPECVYVWADSEEEALKRQMEEGFITTFTGIVRRNCTAQEVKPVVRWNGERWQGVFKYEFVFIR